MLVSDQNLWKSVVNSRSTINIMLVGYGDEYGFAFEYAVHLFVGLPDNLIRMLHIHE